MVGTIHSVTVPHVAPKPDEPDRNAGQNLVDPRPTGAQTVSETALDSGPRQVEDVLKAAEETLNTLAGRQLGDDTRLSIDTDEETGKFVYKSVDRKSGEVVRQFPPEEFLRLIGSMQNLEGLVVDEKA